MRPILLAVTLGVALFFAGYWLGQRTAETARAVPLLGLPAVSASGSNPDPETAKAIASLSEEMQRLRESLGARSTASENRVAADGSLIELTRRTQTLEALVERLNSPRSASGSSLSPALSLRDLNTSPGYRSRAELFHDLDALLAARPPEESDDVQAWNAWTKRDRESADRWTKAHLNWSIQEIIDRYGRPDSVNNEGEGPILNFAGQEPDGSPATLLFLTRNGFVIQVYCEGKGV